MKVLTGWKVIQFFAESTEVTGKTWLHHQW